LGVMAFSLLQNRFSIDCNQQWPRFAARFENDANLVGRESRSV
jgi:hypothetical protein